MGSRKKVVSFEAADKARGDKQIPTSVAPDAIEMRRPGAVAFESIPLRDPSAVDEQFATDALTLSDPQDEIKVAKLQLQTVGGAPGGVATPGITPFGKLVADDSDFHWLQKKRDMEAEANFQQWFAANFDRMSPEQKKMAREMWPEFYAQRLELLSKDVQLLQRIAQLNVTGIQTKEDMLLTYAQEAGYIDMPRLQNLMHPEKGKAVRNAADAQRLFKRGLLNPKRLPHGHNAYYRDYNAKLATGRSFAPVASTFGIGANGFNVQGVTSQNDEQNARNRELLANLPV